MRTFFMEPVFNIITWFPMLPTAEACLLEFIINQHLTASRLIQDRHFYPVTELRHTVYQNNIHILNEGVMPYFIIGNVVLDILNATVISHRYIMQRHMPQTGMLPDSSRQHKF